jgi:hypothetical protein
MNVMMNKVSVTQANTQDIRELTSTEQTKTNGGSFPACYKSRSGKNLYRIYSAYGYYVTQKWSNGAYRHFSSTNSNGDFNNYCRSKGFGYFSRVY